MKTFFEAINEATLQKDYSITASTIGGGLKPAEISFETRRNETKTGSLALEFYSKGPKNYTYRPSQEILDNLERIDGTISYSDEEVKQAEDFITDALGKAQADLSQDLLQLFTKLDEDVKAVLKKHNIYPTE
jgi:hypothetical protein